MHLLKYMYYKYKKKTLLHGLELLWRPNIYEKTKIKSVDVKVIVACCKTSFFPLHCTWADRAAQAVINWWCNGLKAKQTEEKIDYLNS